MRSRSVFLALAALIAFFPVSSFALPTVDGVVLGCDEHADGHEGEDKGGYSAAKEQEKDKKEEEKKVDGGGSEESCSH